MCRRRPACSRRRGGAPMAAAADLGEERVGEREQVAGKLTGDSFCAKEGRKGVVDGRGGARNKDKNEIEHS